MSYEIVTKSAGELESATSAPIALVGNRHSGSVLEWKNIHYSVDLPEASVVPGGPTERTLLYNMSSVARPGQLMAIMGTSGAGKSTLLDVLAGRLESSTLKGELKVNGQDVAKRTFRRETGYVMQSDALFPLLTVREALRYSAYLRMHDKTVEEKNANVEAIIKLLRMEKCADTIAGDEENRGLSGGEKRRLSIGLDIVHFPPIIFLDEPTSGLDSTTALSVVDSLKTLAVSMNCTIVMTIHQPSTRLFNLIDRVIFLAGGKVTFDGEVVDLPAYTKRAYLDAGYGEAPIGNAPEIYLDLCDTLISENKLATVTAAYENNTESSKLLSQQTGQGIQDSGFANNFFAETIILMSRNLKNILRTKELFIGRVFATIFFGILISTLFKHTGDNTIVSLQYRLAYLVFLCAFYYWTSLEALPIFLQEREIFQREFSRGAYRAISYTVAYTVVQWPFQFFLSILFNCITYWIVSLPNVANIFWFQVFVVWTVIVVGNAFATMFSVLVPNPMAGQTAGSGLFSVMFLFSGFFIKGSQIPRYWLWLYYSSLFKYAFDSLQINIFKDHATAYDDLGYGLDNNGILHYFSVANQDRGQGVGILWCWFVFFRVILHYRLVTAFTGSRK